MQNFLRIFQTLNSIKFTIICFALAYYLFGLGAGIFGASIGLVSDVICDVMERNFLVSKNKVEKLFEVMVILPLLFLVIFILYFLAVFMEVSITKRILTYTYSLNAQMAEIIPAINNQEFFAINDQEFALQVNHLLSVSWFVTIILIVPIFICFLEALRKIFALKQEFYNFCLNDFSRQSNHPKTIFYIVLNIFFICVFFNSGYDGFVFRQSFKYALYLCSAPLMFLFFTAITCSYMVLVFVSAIKSSLNEISSFKKSKIGDKND